jgi:cysteine desulfurase/selenocysteine lyase
MSFDASVLALEFPALHQDVNGSQLVYLDNAATTQKPRCVLQAMDDYYREDNANVHRGVHTLSQRATDKFEQARDRLLRHIHARYREEIIFTKGCTEALNLVASSWGRMSLRSGDVVLVSGMEHHANIVPWQMAAEAAGASVEPIPISDRGEIDLEGCESLLRSRPVKMVAVKQACNAMGTRNPIALLARMAHEAGALITVDGAQGLPHGSVDVQAMGADFYSMSAHKAYGPMGVGALYGRRELLEAMPPYQGGGDMIRTVSFEKTTYNTLPNKFEAGTPHVSGVIGFGEALAWLERTGPEAIRAHEEQLLREATARLLDTPGIRIIGEAEDKEAIISFVVEGVHPHDLGTILDRQGVAIRTGHHCCMPLMRRMRVPATARASFAAYNTNQDIEVLIAAVGQARAIFA